jgi:hypothetical protein
MLDKKNKEVDKKIKKDKKVDIKNNASTKKIAKKDEVFKLDMPFKEALDGFLKVNKDSNEH